MEETCTITPYQRKGHHSHMKTLVVAGGCSKAGKTTILTYFANRHGLQYHRKFDLVRQAATSRGIKLDDISSQFDLLERTGFEKLCLNAPADKYSLLDLHYAVQPTFDTIFALGNAMPEDTNEHYIPGISNDNVILLADNFNIKMLYLTANIDTILQRRIHLQHRGVLPRSLSYDNILREQEQEYLQFTRLADIVKQINPTMQSHSICTDDSLEDTIELVAQTLGLRPHTKNPPPPIQPMIGDNNPLHD